MRKRKLIKRLVGPIIMFITTQGVAGEMSTMAQKKEIILKESRLELNALMSAKRLRDLELFTKSL